MEGDLARTADVHVLTDGYVLEQGVRVASTCTLISDGGTHVVADPGLVADRRAILDPLRSLGLDPAAVTDVTLSHHHPDHTVNVALFPNARVHDHWAVYHGDRWESRAAEGVWLTPSVLLLETPGHSPQDISARGQSGPDPRAARPGADHPGPRPTVRPRRTWVTAAVGANHSPPPCSTAHRRPIVPRVKIRPAVRDDIPAIVRLLADDQLGAQREEVAGPPPDEYWRAFEAIDRDPNNVLVVGEDEGEVVATLQLTFIPYLTHRGSWRAQVEAVRVSANRRGQRLGQQLMQWAIDESHRRGCPMVQLTSNKARGDAHRFYEDLGFEASHEGFKLYLHGRGPR